MCAIPRMIQNANMEIKVQHTFALFSFYMYSYTNHGLTVDGLSMTSTTIYSCVPFGN